MTRLSRQVEDVAFLSWARPTSGTPVHIDEAATEAIRAGKTGGYSETAGLLELREEIAAKLARVNGIPARPGEILVTVGAIEGLSAAVMAVVDPGDEVLVPVPGYSTHLRQVVLASGKPVVVPTSAAEGYRLDVDALRAALTPRTKAVLFSSPNNPTGAAYDEDQLRALGAFAVEHDLVVVTDEAYEYFHFDGRKHFSLAAVPEVRDRVISTFTFTKTYAMTGWRIGYVHASREWIAELMKAHIPFCICAPVASQYAALGALRGPQDCVEEFRAHYERTRNLMCDRLDRLPHVFSYHRPDGAYLMLPKVEIEEGADSLEFAKRLLFEAKVSTTPGVAFGAEGHLRMSFCVPEETIDLAFDRMEAWFGV
jgi:aminotransferase